MKAANISTISYGQSSGDTVDWEEEAKRLARLIEEMQHDKAENVNIIAELQH